MDRPRVTVEQFLWILVLALAFGVRFLNLGVQPLSDLEAGWALHALSLFPGSANIEILPPGPQPGYIALTGLLFSLFGSGDLLARTLPAAAGALLCLVPFFFREQIGRRAALIMAFCLALDPGLVAVSRLGGGVMPALSFLLLGLGLLVSRRAILSGVMLGMGLLSGLAAWQGLLILALTGLFTVLLEKAGWILPASVLGDSERGLFPPISTWAAVLVSAGVTVLGIGTLFGLFPQGLGAMSASLPGYLVGWAAPQEQSMLLMLSVILVYQPLAMIFGLIAGVRSWIDGNAFAQRMVIWVFVALGMVVFYPARQVGDMVWVVVPLWGLASIELARYLDIASDHRSLVFGQAALVFTMLTLFWLNLAGTNLSLLDQRGYLMRTGIFLGALFLVGLTTILLGYGWTWKAAVQGLVWGLVAALGIYQIAGMWNSSQSISAHVINVWLPRPQTGENHLFMQTIKDLSHWSTGRSDEIDVIVAVDSPSMRWSFRNFPNADFIPESEVISLGETPSIIITSVEAQTPALAASYRGQDFPWWRYPGWSGILPQELPHWVAYRSNPAGLSSVILWARADLFPVGTTSAADSPIQPDEPDTPLEPDVLK